MEIIPSVSLMEIIPGVSLGVLALEEVWEQKLRRISENICILPRKEVRAIAANGGPIIISTMPEIGMVIVAHTSNLSIIDRMVHAFEKKGVSPSGITMTIQTADEATGVSFVEKAMSTGIQQVWSSDQLPRLLEQLGPAVADERMFTIRHT